MGFSPVTDSTPSHEPVYKLDFGDEEDKASENTLTKMLDWMPQERSPLPGLNQES